MDQEIKNKLLGRLPFTKDVEYTFIPKSCIGLPDEYTPKVTIKPLDKAAKDNVLQLESKGDFKAIYPIIEKHIVRIENLFDVSEEKYIDYKFEYLTEVMILDIYRSLSAISGLREFEKLGL